MKSPLLQIFVLLALASLSHAQSNAMPPALGLLRLKATVGANDAASLVASKFIVDDLSATGATGAVKSKRNNVDYVALDGGKEWARSLRGNARDVTFVSFQIYASQTTIIDVAGARVGLTASPMTGSLQLMYDDSMAGALQWKSLNYHVSAETFAGKTMAPLPTLTVRIDPSTATWDVFVGSRLLADDLPLIEAKRSDRRFSVRAGSEGAWITGLVLSDENPLYGDANGNGIDDAFEQRHRGGLLAVSATRAERASWVQLWKEEQRRRAPPPLLVTRIQPDVGAVPKR